ncbi:Diphthamide biosynthesis protein 2 [Dinochytrium kinnereticum]|nr:Diphthamide biosynthesis protein 2 [Dinochytrium kinnereticum]
MDLTDEMRTACEVERTAEVIREGGFSKVALQFPDELLHLSAAVVSQLTHLCKGFSLDPLPLFFVLADTTYGSCCVDEIAADHVNADLIIHYGHSCGKEKEKEILGSSRTPYRKMELPEGRALEEYSILYFGEETLALTNVVMTFSKKKVYSYSPANSEVREESAKVNRLLARRYNLMQRAKDANVIGIVVGTLGIADYHTLIVDLKHLIISAGKKPYIIAVGKPNVAKLGNFLDVDVFVLVACPENLLMDAKEFMRPIVTPFELEASINRPEDWFSDYVLDLSEIRSRVTAGLEEAEKDLASDTSGLSLQTRTPGTVTALTNSRALTFLNESRTYRGLEVRQGETEVKKAVDGLAGTASGYASEL